MRPLAFTAFPDRPVTINPATVARVEVASATRHAVCLILAGASGDGERSMCVAEFPDRKIAIQLGRRIGEHLWSDDAPPLTAEEQNLIERNPPTSDDGPVVGRRSVPTGESKHPSLVFERSKARS